MTVRLIGRWCALEQHRVVPAFKGCNGYSYYSAHYLNRQSPLVQKYLQPTDVMKINNSSPMFEASWSCFRRQKKKYSPYASWFRVHYEKDVPSCLVCLCPQSWTPLFASACDTRTKASSAFGTHWVFIFSESQLQKLVRRLHHIVQSMMKVSFRVSSQTPNE